MRHRYIPFLLAGCAMFVGSLCAWQREFREYPAIEYNNFPLPENARRPSEWVFARLMYPPAPTARFDRSGRTGWANGMSSWTQDYPRADRHFLAARNLDRLGGAVRFVPGGALNAGSTGTGSAGIVTPCSLERT